MKLVPYNHPRVDSYDAPAFKSGLPRWRSRIQRLLERQPMLECQPNGNWLELSPGSSEKNRARSNARPSWTPKAYLCIEAPDYWRAILVLISLTNSLQIRWKFLYGGRPGDFQRPDKIVLYFDSAARARRCLVALSVRLDGYNTHALSHAAPATSALNSRNINAGLFVGSDPAFIGASWRLYSLLCRAWALQNHDGYFGGSRRRRDAWIRGMNIDARNGGPLRLVPPRSTNRKILVRWKMLGLK